MRCFSALGVMLIGTVVSSGAYAEEAKSKNENGSFFTATGPALQQKMMEKTAQNGKLGASNVLYRERLSLSVGRDVLTTRGAEYTALSHADHIAHSGDEAHLILKHTLLGDIGVDVHHYVLDIDFQPQLCVEVRPFITGHPKVWIEGSEQAISVAQVQTTVKYGLKHNPNDTVSARISSVSSEGGITVDGRSLVFSAGQSISLQIFQAGRKAVATILALDTSGARTHPDGKLAKKPLRT